ncbi:MAG: recombination protein O N-terminal domain-containing protein [Altererythrobacter sp.]|nr:recombination protein O N-terminal domain-containing protein [Altererythrobacter sp.]OJU59504.1 MAG: DNA recombination protein RecO [Altererythrobacter sp. 66-12]
MHLRAPAILLAARAHGETAVIARMFTEEHGVVAGYVAGGRGRHLRPVVIPGNLVALDLSARSDSQLPFARLELLASRGPWLAEPLPAAAIGWASALTATALPERQPYPALYTALTGLLDAVCHAPSARGWIGALAAYETLLLRELGYGGDERPEGDVAAILAAMDRLAVALDHYLLADRRGDVMAARARLRELLGRMLT